MLFDVVFKIPEDKYEDRRDNYDRMLNSFKASGDSSSEFLSISRSTTFSSEKNRVGRMMIYPPMKAKPTLVCKNARLLA